MKAAVACLGFVLSLAVLATTSALPRPASERKAAAPGLPFSDLGETNPALKGYKGLKGIKVEIIAEAPTVINPIGMTFSDEGVPFVLEWLPSPGNRQAEETVEFKYRDGSTRKIVCLRKPVKDSIKMLEASGGRPPAVYDRTRVVLEEELPSTVLLHDGWLYTASRGSVRRWKASKPGGTLDVKEVVAQGFGGAHPQVSGLTISNDGLLYIAAGSGDNFVEGSDGARALALQTGAIFRCKPDGSKLETFAIGFRHPSRDVAFDAAFNMFHADVANDDGSRSAGYRLLHVLEGSDFGWRQKPVIRSCVPEAVRSAVFGEPPARVPLHLDSGRGAPAGLLVYNDTFFPERYRGLIYYPDATRQSIRACKVVRKGSSFKVAEEFEFLRSDDPLFRPCQITIGPDGAMYVVDRRTPSSGTGELWGDGKNGRIYRITWGGTREQEAIPTRGLDAWAKIRKQSDEELLKTSRSENFSDRRVAQNELIKRGPNNRGELIKLLEDGDTPSPARLMALGALQALWNAEVAKAVRGRLIDQDPDLRRLALDALGLHGEARGVEVVGMLEDGDLDVRRAAALALGRTRADGTADSLVNAIVADDSRDPLVFDGLVRALELTGKTGIDRLLGLFESGEKKKTDLVVDTFLRLRTRPAAEAIPQLLNYPHLSIKQRTDLVLSYANYLVEPPLKFEPLLDYLIKNGNEALSVKLAGLEALSLGSGLGSAKAQKWLLTLLDDREASLRLAVLAGIEQSRATAAVPRVLELLKDETRPLAEREAAARTLRALAASTAVPALKTILAGKGEKELSLRREALRALFALDRKTGQNEAVAILGAGEVALRGEAVLQLGTDAQQAKDFGKRHLEKKLPSGVLPEVTIVLKRHAVQGDREAGDLLEKVMKLGFPLSKAPTEVARLRALVRSQGSAERGKSLYLENKALACVKCHKLEGIGGNIGPDLTKLWQTLPLEKLVESIIDPSKEIKEGFQTFVITSKKGQFYSGLKISQDAKEIVLRDVNGSDLRIAGADVESAEKSTTSLMPDNVLTQLNYEEFLDLLAFLQDPKAQETLREPRLP